MDHTPFHTKHGPVSSYTGGQRNLASRGAKGEETGTKGEPWAGRQKMTECKRETRMLAKTVQQHTIL